MPNSLTAVTSPHPRNWGEALARIEDTRSPRAPGYMPVAALAMIDAWASRPTSAGDVPFLSYEQFFKDLYKTLFELPSEKAYMPFYHLATGTPLWDIFVSGSPFVPPRGVPPKSRAPFSSSDTYARIGKALLHEISVATDRSRIRQTLVDLACDAFRDNNDLVDRDDAREFREGAASYRMHLHHERSAALRREAIATARRQGRQPYQCQACDFDFLDVYTVKYIELHHTKPISEMKPGESTKLDDTVLLCANCHRLIHRRQERLDLEALRALVRASNGRTRGA